jgi:flagellin-like protein
MGMKGISPIIAAVVLIAISVAVGVMISSWVTHWVTSQTGVTTQCVALTNYNIESATYTSNNKNLTMVVKNLGSIQIYGLSVQMMNLTNIVIYNDTSPDIKVTPNLSKQTPLTEQRSAIIVINLNGTQGDYSELARTAEEVTVFNKACPAFSAKIPKKDIIKE